MFRVARSGRRKIFIGDFNAKSRSWNCEKGDAAGEVLEEVLDEEGMVVVNFGTLSRIGRPDQVASNIDLVIVPTENALDINARETGETGGSDHQVIEFRWGEEANWVGERLRGRRYRMEKVDKTELLKWLIRSEEKVKEIVRSRRGIEVRCKEIVELMGMGIEESYKGPRMGRGNRNGGGERNGNRNRNSNRNEKRVRRQPWWDEECEELKEERRRATKEMGKRLTEGNWERLKEARKKMEEAIKRKKTKAWEDFIKSIKYKGNIGEMWKKVKSLARGVTMEDQRDMGTWEIKKMEEEEVRKLKETGYCCRLGEEEEEEEEEAVNNEERGGSVIDEGDEEGESREDWISRDLEMEELEGALRTVKGKSALGEDGIGYDVMKMWTLGWREAMLELYNEVWNKGNIPIRWKMAVVKFIPKPQKKALRLISLMNRMRKLLERLVNERMRIWAEENGKMDNNQSGFRKGRSTMDNIGILVNNIKECWGKRKMVTAAFIDVKAAYDNVVHKEVAVKLRNMDCPRKIRRYILAWLRERRVEIRGLDGVVIPMKLLKGLPQGSVLSPLLYNLYTAKIAEGLGELGVKILQYADDIVIVYE
ncbi:uncharacterized protein LOC143265396 [Megachile rotundata]|uniref:uncharacterized protein LOC143265396 n=1 Tax=Megachile rotundata TaxID=143995 RepID=UPI003FD0F175